MVSELELMIIHLGYNCLHFLYDGLLWLAYSAGTVFREPIICKNIPRLVPSMYDEIAFTFLWWCSRISTDCDCYQVGTSLYASEGMLLVINTEQLIQLLKELGN